MYLHSVLDASWMTCSHEMTAWPKIKRLDQDEESNSFRDKGRTSFFRDRPSSETQGLLAGTMRYLWAKVYFKSWRAYSYRTSSRSGRISSCWLGRKIFFCPISDEVWPGNSVAFLHEVVFFIDRPSCLARATGKLSWRVSEKKFNQAKETASLNMGARNQYSSINFLGKFVESISYVFVANVRDLYTVVFWLRES